MCVGRIHTAENVDMSFACRKSRYLTTLSNAQIGSTHMHNGLSGDTALMLVRLYCENRGLYALLGLNKARGSEL